MIHERYIKPVDVHPVVRRLAESRIAWGMSQRDIAKRIGCDQPKLANYELGKLLPSMKTLMRWADVMGFELSLWPKESAK